MSVNDPLGDMIARIRNAQMRGRSTVRTPASTLRRRVLEVLQSEGYIRGFEVVDGDEKKPEIEIALKYHDGRPAIRELKRVSKPGRRAYSGVKALPNVRNGLGVAIVSTPRGVMSDAQARADNVGGEVLCTVF
jgi:small subunit ribosomal protein S8